MAISIKHDETEQLIRALAGLKGQSITLTVLDAVRHELAIEQKKRGTAELTADLLRMSKRAAAHMNHDGHAFSSSDVDAFLYDDRGLPK